MISSRRRLAIVAALVGAGCGASTLVSTNPGNDGGSDAGVDGADGAPPPPPSGCSDPDAAACNPATVPGGPCVDGMQCTTSAPQLYSCGNDYPACTCVGGRWSCPTAAGMPPPLPVGTPRAGDDCSWAASNFTCTIPDQCGMLCSCVHGQFFDRWQCATVRGVGSDAGSPCSASPCPDGGGLEGDADADAGCYYLSCVTIGACECHEH